MRSLLLFFFIFNLPFDLFFFFSFFALSLLFFDPLVLPPFLLAHIQEVSVDV